MADLAGSVTVEIGGNVMPFEAALARAQEMATAFDRQMSAKLSGSATGALAKIAATVEQINATLARLASQSGGSTSGLNQVATASDRVSTSLSGISKASAAAAAALTEVTAGAREAQIALDGTMQATASNGVAASVAGLEAATVSAKDFARALEMTGGDLARVTPAMIGIADAEKAMADTGTVAAASLGEVTAGATAAQVGLEGVTASATEAKAAVSGLSSATIGSASASELQAATISAKDFAAALQATGGNLKKVTPDMLGLSDAEKSVATAEKEVATSADVMAAGMARAGASASEAAALSAGVSREFIVLGREAVSGNWSRIPGSLLVMSNRLQTAEAGTLSLATAFNVLKSIGSTVFNPFVLGTLAVFAAMDAATHYFTSVKSGADATDTILKEHKQLIDDIAAAYPKAAQAAKDYEAQAAKLPASILQADTAQNVRKTTSAYQDQLASIESILAQATALNRVNAMQYGVQGMAAFSALNSELRQGKIDAQGLLDELGKMQIDPSLPQPVRDLALKLEDAAKNALELQTKLHGAGAAARELENVNPLSKMSSDALQKLTTQLNEQAKSIVPNVLTGDFGGSQLIAATQDASGLAASLGIVSASTSKASDAMNGFATNAKDGMISVVDMAQQAANAKLTQLLGLEQAGQELSTLKTRLSDVKTQLDALSMERPEQVWGALDPTGAMQAALDAANGQIRAIFASMQNGSMSAVQAYRALEQVRQNLEAFGGDTKAVDEYFNKLVQAYMETNRLSGAVDVLSQTIKNIPDRLIKIGIQQYSVPSAGGGMSNVTVYGGSMGTYTSYDVGGGSSVGVYTDTQPTDSGNPAVPTAYDVGNGQTVNVYASGGFVKGPGTGTSDSIMARLSNGEFVMSADATMKYRSLLEAMNAGNIRIPGFATGGAVDGSVSPAASLVSGYSDLSSVIESYLYDIKNELISHTQYFSVFESDFQAMITAMGGLAPALSGSIATGTSGIAASLSSATIAAINAGLGVIGQTTNGQPIFNLGTGSPYHYNAAAAGIGVSYNAVADYTLNHNPQALARTGTEAGALASKYGYTAMSSAQYQQALQAAQQQGLISGGPTNLFGSFSIPGFASGGQIMPGEDQKVEFFKRASERVIIVDDSKVMDARGPGAKGTDRAQQVVNVGPVYLQLPAQANGDMRQSAQAAADIFARSVKQAMATR